VSIAGFLSLVAISEFMLPEACLLLYRVFDEARDPGFARDRWSLEFMLKRELAVVGIGFVVFFGKLMDWMRSRRDP
jgi:hypothetical protein